MKKSLLIVLVLLISFSNVFSQTVEKIFETEDIKLKVHVTNAEAMGYLKEYDSEKYAGSLERAEELGLKTQFLNNEVLVWGKTYYSTIANMIS